MPTKGKPSDLSPKPWQERLDPDFHLRRPRPGVEYVETLLDSSLPPGIFLTENEQSTDIVIRFPATSHKLPGEVRAAYFTPDFTLAKAFEQVLRGFSETADDRSVRTELARVAYRAFRSAWLQVFTTRYLHQFHPKSDERLQAAMARLRGSSNIQKGRPKESPSDRRNVEQKYEAMLEIATLFHQIATKVVGEFPPGSAVSTEEVAKKIWAGIKEDLSDKLYGARAAELVFSGAAFQDLILTRGGASLVKPSGWQPDELALTLLNLDEPKRYTMARDKLTAVRSKKRAKS
jgi:hypothetical protein